MPVFVGAEPDYDACPSTGTVMGLDPQGDGFLSVRSGPGGRAYQEIDRVFNGQHVFICSQDGPWFAVVYTTERGLNCNVSGLGQREWLTQAHVATVGFIRGMLETSQANPFGPRRPFCLPHRIPVASGEYSGAPDS